MKFQKNKLTSIILAGVMLFSTITCAVCYDSDIANACISKTKKITQIPNTTKSQKNYDKSFLSVTGFASVDNKISDRSAYIGTSYYAKVTNEREFLDAIVNASSGVVKVIEIQKDLNLGWNELALTTEEKEKYTFVSKYGNPSAGFTNPNMEVSGVTKINLANIKGLTIFSKNASIIKHTELKLQASSSDIVFRNIDFREMWQWDDTGKHKEVGWTFIKINGANNVWIDHCSFENAADGNVDMENGSSGVTLSWCKFGLEADETPSKDSSIYVSVMYMEDLYQAGSLTTSSRYYNLRSNGATVKQIMAYTAYHSKTHLVGSGDKDYTNYVNSAGVEKLDGNQRLQLTMAYCYYLNVGQRVPMIRQGTGHMINCYIDDSKHMKLQNLDVFNNYGGYKLARAINARNGASIAADTCVFNGVEQVMVGAESQGDDLSNMNSPWDVLFANAYNRILIVNSKVTNSNGSYTGSSWDNNGDNLFTTGYTWKDKSTIGNWAWSSSIVGVENMSKSTPPSEAFEFEYDYTEKLPYTYKTLPLSKVTKIIPKCSGAGNIKLSTKDWLKTNYR